MAFTITNSGKDTLISDGTQNPSFNRNFMAGLTKATAVENPQTGDLDTVQVVDTTKQAILMPYDDITDIGGSTPAALGLLDATQVASYLNNNYFSLAGGGGGSLPAGTADKNNLQWNNTLGQWVDNPNVKFGYQSSDLSGSVTGTYGTFDYGTGYAWRWKSYPNADGTSTDNHVITDNFISTSAYDSRQRRNVELLNVPVPEAIGTVYAPASAFANEWFAETSDYNLSERIIAAPNVSAKNTITPLTIVDEVNEGGTTINTVTQTKDYVQTVIGAYSFQHTIGYDGADVLWEVEGSDGVNTFNGIITANEVSFQIASNTGGINCTADSAAIIPTNVGSLFLGEALIVGSGFYLLTYGSYGIIQGKANDTNVVTNPTPTGSSLLLASGSSIGLDPDTAAQPYNSVALGGTNQELKVANTAYASGMATRSVTTDAGGLGYTLDMDNDPINLLVMDVTGQADTFYIPAASAKFLDVEVIVKKIGAFDLTIDDGGSGTVEQVGGGFGNTYVIAGTNSAVTIKCIYSGINYYWIVY